jgi:LacI family transcriptional regulator
LLLIGNERPQATWDFIDKRRVAHVVSWCHEVRAGSHVVGFDNGAAAADSARRVLALGHRRLAMIAGDASVNDRARARRDGIIAAVNVFGDGARLTHVVEAPYLLDAGAQGFEEVMQQSETPTVVLCGNDALAAGAMMRARERGMRLPDEMSFVGFDDIGLARVLTPPLATVRVPQQEIGRAAAQLLIAKIAGETEVSSTVFPTEFVHRGSLVESREA